MELIKCEGNSEQSVKEHESKKSFQLGKSEWWVIHEEYSRKTYFYNAVTKKTQWLLPETEVKNYQETIDDISKKEKIQIPKFKEDLNIKIPTRKIPIYPSKTKKRNKQVPNTSWWVIDDPKEPKKYFYNSNTYQCLWDLPIEVKVQLEKSMPHLLKNNIPLNKKNEIIPTPSLNNINLPQLEKLFPRPIPNNNPLNQNDSNKFRNEKNLISNFPDSLKNLKNKRSTEIFKQNALVNNSLMQSLENFHQNSKVTVNNGRFKEDLDVNGVVSGDLRFEDVFGNDKSLFVDDNSKRDEFFDKSVKLQENKIEFLRKDSLFEIELQKKRWQEKYIKLKDKYINLQINKNSLNSSKSSNLKTEHSNSSKSQLLPIERDELFKSILTSLQKSNRKGLEQSLSNSDLKQAVLLKAFYMGKNVLEMMCLILQDNEKTTKTNEKESIDKNVKNPFICFFCGKAHSLEEDLEKHLRDFCGRNFERKDAFECYFCPEKFISRVLMEIHMRKYHRKKMDFIDCGLKQEITKIKTLPGEKFVHKLSVPLENNFNGNSNTNFSNGNSSNGKFKAALSVNPIETSNVISNGKFNDNSNGNFQREFNRKFKESYNGIGKDNKKNDYRSSEKSNENINTFNENFNVKINKRFNANLNGNLKETLKAKLEFNSNRNFNEDSYKRLNGNLNTNSDRNSNDNLKEDRKRNSNDNSYKEFNGNSNINSNENLKEEWKRNSNGNLKESLKRNLEVNSNRNVHKEWNGNLNTNSDRNFNENLKEDSKRNSNDNSFKELNGNSNINSNENLKEEWKRNSNGNLKISLKRNLEVDSNRNVHKELNGNLNTNSDRNFNENLEEVLKGNLEVNSNRNPNEMLKDKSNIKLKSNKIKNNNQNFKPETNKNQIEIPNLNLIYNQNVNPIGKNDAKFNNQNVQSKLDNDTYSEENSNKKSEEIMKWTNLNSNSTMKVNLTDCFEGVDFPVETLRDVVEKKC